MQPAMSATVAPVDVPYYLPVCNETEVFRACHAQGLPVMLKGPTGCGKTRFVEHMAHLLGRPLITVACHDDLSASDLTGRYLIRGSETVWTQPAERRLLLLLSDGQPNDIGGYQGSYAAGDSRRGARGRGAHVLPHGGS
jgi:hypothetical protein